MRGRLLKRTFDLLVAVPLLVASLPVQAVIATLVRRRLGSPVLFRQERAGRDGRPFTIVKFRTMLDVNSELGLVEDRNRITDFGRILRASSLDELPTLWNVVRGDMSLVGPRPLLPEYLAVYLPRHIRRHEVCPGITGLAQVSGRNSIGWAEKLELDIAYVESWSFRLDLAILWRTIRTVAARSGIDYSYSTTYPPLKPGYATALREDVEDETCSKD
ncbi:sugar transferase [Intrasporangium chromatireducens]|uniref:sugar transferase n=1 Tax=Intrasporangium chromatireducens TaxID=1386088 RepID=UPI0004B53C21|nr:sugar transferase [Intrasporangium chromatireducens]